MAYKIYYGHTLMFDQDEDALKVSSASIDLSATGPSKMKIVLPPTHPMVDSILLHDFDNLITIGSPDGTSGTDCASYVTSISKDIDNMTTITATGVLAWLDMERFSLRDYGYTDSSDSARDLVNSIIDCYRRASGRDVVINNYAPTNIYAECDPSEVLTALEMLKKWVIDPCGVVMLSNMSSAYGEGTLTIWFGNKYYDNVTGTAVERGVNLTGIQRHESDDGLATGVYVVGGKVLKSTVAKSAGTNGAYIAVANSRDRGGDSVFLRCASQGVATYTINDGDKLEIDGDVYVAYLPLSRSVTITRTSSKDVPLTTPLQKSVFAGEGVYAYYQDVQFSEQTADLSAYDGQSYTYAGITAKVSDKVMYEEANAERYGLITELYVNEGCFRADYLRDVAQTYLASKLSTELSIEADMFTSEYVFRQGGPVPGRRISITDDVIGATGLMTIADATIDLLDPGNSKFTIGKSARTATSKISDLSGRIDNVAYNVRKTR